MKRFGKAKLFAATGAIFSSVSLFNGAASAVNVTWSPTAASDDLRTASNWTLGVLPVAANDVFFGPSANFTNLTLSSAATYFSMAFNSDAPAYTIGAVGGAFNITVGANGNPPTGGTITNNSALTQTFNTSMAIRRGTMDAANGDLVFAGTFNVGNNGTGPTTALRNITITGSHNTTISGQLIGSANLTTAGIPDDDIANLDNGRLIKDGTGTLFLTNNNNNTNFTGPITVNTGALQANVSNAFGANGTVTIAAATVTLGATHVSGGANTGRVELVGDVSFAPETLVLEGRTVGNAHLANVSGNNTWTGAVNIVGSGSYAVQSDSGTLTISGNITDISADSTIKNVGIRGAGNGVISGNIVQGLGSAGMGLTKEGSGAWTLTGANSYTGATVVSGGALRVGNGATSGSLGSGTVTLSGGSLIFNRSDNTVVSNAIGGASGSIIQSANSLLTLSGNLSYQGSTIVQAGTLSLSTAKTGGGAISVADAAAITVNSTVPSSSLAASALTVGGAGGSTLNFSLGTAGNPSQALINTGMLTRNGNNVVNLLGSNFSVGTIGLIQYTGSAAGSGSFSLGSLPNCVLANLVDTGSAINLHITGIDFPRWTGAVNNIWDTSSNANPKDWVLNSNGTTPTDYINGDSVLFNDLSSVNDVSISGTVTPNAITVNNSNKNYTFSGSGGISGFATLTKTGTGTLTFTNSGVNDFSGAISIAAGGTISVGNGGTSGSIGTGTITNNGVLVLNRTDGAVLANSISGSGPILVRAGSRATLSGSSDFGGAVTVESGAELSVNGVNSLGNTTGATIVQSGASLIIGNGGSSNFAAEPLTIGGAGTGASQGAIRAVGSLIGNLTGNVTLSSSATLFGDAGATGVLSGTINGAGKDMTVAGDGTWAISGSGNNYTNTIINHGTLQVGVGGTTGDLGSGTILIADGGTLSISRSNLVALSNQIAGAGAVNMNGQGTAVLSGSNTFTGPVSITQGVVRATNNDAFGTGAKTITTDTRNKGVELDGGVTLPSSISFLLSNDGDLTQGGATVPFAIRSISGNNTINGDILLKTGGGSSAVKVDAGGTVNLNGNISIQVGAGGRAIQLGGSGTGYVNGVVSDGLTGELMGISITGAGAPTWTLNNANTCTGAVTLQSGTLNLTNASALGQTFGSFCFIGNGGAAFANIPAAVNISLDGVTVANNLWTNRDGAGGAQLPQAESLNRHIGFNGASGAGTFAGAVQINGGAIFHATPNGTLVMSGVLQNGTETFANGGRNDVFSRSSGTVIFSGANTYTGFTQVDSGTLVLMSAAHAPVVSGAGGADLRGGRMVLDYSGGGTDPLPTLYPVLQAGFATNFATGQIRSSNATAEIGIGFKDDTSGQRLHLMRTYLGDADLNGTVSSTDFSALAGAYGAASGAVWTQGDFNYDGKVNTVDFNYLAGNFGLTIAAPLPGSGIGDLGSVVPEPATAGALLVVAMGTMGRRRRRHVVG